MTTRKKLTPMKLRFLVKLAITVALLAYLSHRTDWFVLRKTLSGIRLIPFIGACLVSLLGVVPLAARLRALLAPTVLRFSLMRIIEIHFISMFYSLMLPSGLGISIVRWYKVTQNRTGRRLFAAITVIERLMLVSTVLLLVGVPLLLAGTEMPAAFRSSALPIIFILLTFCLIFFSILLHPGIYGKISQLAGLVQRKSDSELLRRAIGIYEDFGIYLNKRPLIAKAFSYNMIFFSLSFACFYLVFVSIGVTLPAKTVLWISMLVLLITNLPVSLIGLGVRESSYSWLLSFYGIEPERGALLGGMISMMALFNIIVGALLSLFEKNRSPEDIAPQPDISDVER